MNEKDFQEMMEQQGLRPQEAGDLAAPSLAANPPPPPAGEADPRGDYIVTYADVGMTLRDLDIKAEGAAAPTKLTADDLDFLDEYVTQGYGRRVVPLGRKADAELQTITSSMQMVADQMILDDITKTTQIGLARINNLYTLALHLARFGATWLSYQPDAQGQEEAQAADEAARRQVFESPAGLRHRIHAVKNLDGLFIDHLNEHINTLSARMRYLLRYEQIENF